MIALAQQFLVKPCHVWARILSQLAYTIPVWVKRISSEAKDSHHILQNEFFVPSLVLFYQRRPSSNADKQHYRAHAVTVMPSIDYHLVATVSLFTHQRLWNGINS